MPVNDDQNLIVQSLDESKSAQEKLASRRNLLRMGAAGLPMVLTLKASARQAALSQLQCFFRLPSRYRIMVNSNGEAWASTTNNVGFNNNRQAWRGDQLDDFILPANSVHFPAGVPAVYIPAPETQPRQGRWVYGGWAKYSISNNAKITPRNYINSNDEFEFNGSNKELFVALTIQYADGRTSGWPGVSCIISILAYLDTL